MPYERAIDESAPVTTPPCMHLRSKSMYVEGTQRPSENSPCWCNQTQHVLGPDQQFAGARNCTTGRECYRPSMEV